MNTNCLQGIMCPQCGHTTNFYIVVEGSVLMTDEGHDGPRDTEWGDYSPIMCPNCQHQGVVEEFQHPDFYVTFDTVIEESAEAGESHRKGWWEPGGHLIENPIRPPLPAFIFDPDDYAPDEASSLDGAIVEWAVALLKREGAMHPNCEPSDDTTWWGTEGNEVLDFASGETIRKSFHFNGFSDQLRRRVNARMAKED